MDRNLPCTKQKVLRTRQQLCQLSNVCEMQLSKDSEQLQETTLAVL